MVMDPVTRLNAALEGRYRIERQLGEGGMATVYLARDLKHNRNVALKVLKPELAAVVGAERFLAEIETTANLQHSHILPLFDSGEADGFLFYVMPYVDGESLRERLDRERQLPVDEAVGIATNVAEALDYAHRHGVIHRDIKPANILLQDGKPLVSDFGIALAVTAGGAGRLTETGLSLGTPHYMSPEQATGDVRVGGGTDIYALGCVLYEMLVGEPPYTGSTPQAVLGKIIQAKPVAPTEARRTVPANVDAAVRKSLEKVPADRFRTAADFARALADPGFLHGTRPEVTGGAARAARVGPWNRLTVGFAGLAGVLAVAAVWLLLGRPPAASPAPVHRFEILFPEGGALAPNVAQPIGITPDGESVIVNVAIGAVQQLYVRRLGSLEMAPVRGTEGVGSFFVSPDGEWVGLNDPQASAFVKLPLGGGEASTIAATPGSASGFRGADWGDSGAIVYGSGSFQGLMTVRDVGGVPDTLTSPQSGESHLYPRVLPGGQTVLFEVDRSGQQPQIAALSVATGAYDVLTQGEIPDYVTGGFVVFRRGSVLWAAGFDPDRRALTDDPVPVVEGIAAYRSFALSDNVTLVFMTGSGATGSGMRLGIVGLDGHKQFLPLVPRPIEQAVWSPDGRTVAFKSGDQIYTYDVVVNSAPRQLTFDGANQRPVFSPDGTRVAFTSLREGTNGPDLFVKDLNSDAPPRSILTRDGNQLVMQWPADSLLLFEQQDQGSLDLWMVDVSDPESPEAKPYLTSDYSLQRIALSPDGRLAAYQSMESGTLEVYVRSFPNPGVPTIVSRGGGGIPSWSPDGRTLYYFTGPGTPVIAARMQRDPVPAVLALDTLKGVGGDFGAEPFGGALHPDGDRFIAAFPPAGAKGASALPPSVVIVENFRSVLEQALGK